MPFIITFQNSPLSVPDGSSAGQVMTHNAPGSDILIVNGYPVEPEYCLQQGDTLLCITRGSVPTAEELQYLMAARHTPGVHQRLQQATVGIAGVGGLGSAIATALVRVGIGHLIYADFDLVEPSNLNRQQYFSDQIGLTKVHALTDTLTRINPYTKLEPHHLRLGPGESEELFKTCDIVIEAFDQAEAKAMLADTVLTRLQNTILIAASGVAGFGDCNAIVTRRISDRFYLVGDGVSEAAVGRGLMAPRVGVAAGHQADLVITILMERS